MRIIDDFTRARKSKKELRVRPATKGRNPREKRIRIGRRKFACNNLRASQVSLQLHVRLSCSLYLQCCKLQTTRKAYVHVAARLGLTACQNINLALDSQPPRLWTGCVALAISSGGIIDRQISCSAHTCPSPRGECAHCANERLLCSLHNPTLRGIGSPPKVQRVLRETTCIPRQPTPSKQRCQDQIHSPRRAQETPGPPPPRLFLISVRGDACHVLPLAGLLFCSRPPPLLQPTGSSALSRCRHGGKTPRVGRVRGASSPRLVPPT